ncbi:hypothetical protein H4Q26_000177 [Puccinia striiformis f. sp. tritici PST-130]|nr:hypothetical protein H4Q26_000177 [Puccinia striiformis f. sp. tritici PST-130]
MASPLALDWVAVMEITHIDQLHLNVELMVDSLVGPTLERLLRGGMFWSGGVVIGGDGRDLKRWSPLLHPFELEID